MKRSRLFALILLPESLLLTVFLVLLGMHTKTERLEDARTAAEICETIDLNGENAQEMLPDTVLELRRGEDGFYLILGRGRRSEWGICRPDAEGTIPVSGTMQQVSEHYYYFEK